MKTRYLVLILAMAFSVSSLANDASEERGARQATLDAACEVARQQKLVLVRAKRVAACIEKKERPDQASCERFYADYGARIGNRPPMFYDLPACVKAHNFRTSYRRSDN